jgi:hypothetical protein
MGQRRRYTLSVSSAINLCGCSLFGASNYVEKDGEFLCDSHKTLVPVKKHTVRPKKVGPWQQGDLCIARHGSLWRVGMVESVHNNVAIVVFGETRVAVSKFDLRVANMGCNDISNRKHQLFSIAKKGVPLESVKVLRKHDSLAQFAVVPGAEQGNRQQQDPEPSKSDDDFDPNSSTIDGDEARDAPHPICALKFNDNEEVLVLDGDFGLRPRCLVEMQSAKTGHFIWFNQMVALKTLQCTRVR